LRRAETGLLLICGADDLRNADVDCILASGNTAALYLASEEDVSAGDAYTVCTHIAQTSSNNMKILFIFNFLA
jgi:hypothetical protein